MKISYLYALKKCTLPLLLLFLVLGCKNDDEPSTANLSEEQLLNVAYGTDPEQRLDIYLPEGRDENTKVIILVHGGGWSGGSRSSFNYFVPVLKQQFPDHAIVNIDYRLATLTSPGFPKQIQDIEKVVEHLKTTDYHISDDYAMIGASAGAHLSMLYAYNYDPTHDVKAVASIVGPTDFTDPSYTDEPLFDNGLYYLLGPTNYDVDPSPYIEVSPRTHVTAQAPPTIMFYGGQDPIVPATQGPRLKQKLDEFGVYNEFNIYPEGGHGDWDELTMIDFQTKLIAFLHAEF